MAENYGYLSQSYNSSYVPSGPSIPPMQAAHAQSKQFIPYSGMPVGQPTHSMNSNMTAGQPSGFQNIVGSYPQIPPSHQTMPGVNSYGAMPPHQQVPQQGAPSIIQSGNIATHQNFANQYGGPQTPAAYHAQLPPQNIAPATHMSSGYVPTNTTPSVMGQHHNANSIPNSAGPYGGVPPPNNQIPPQNSAYFGGAPNAINSLLPVQQQQQIPQLRNPMSSSGPQPIPLIPDQQSIGAGNYYSGNAIGSRMPSNHNTNQSSNMRGAMHGGSQPRGGFSAPSSHRANYRGGHNRFGDRNEALGLQQNGDAIRPDTVYITRIPKGVDHEAIKAEFGKFGKIKENNKTGMPMVWIFKEGGIPRGDGLVTYEYNSSADSAIKHYQNNDFKGSRIEVRLATNSERPKIVPPGGGSSGGGDHGNREHTISTAPPKNISRGGPSRGNYGSGGRGNATVTVGGPSRDGDWRCTQCSNSNFSWRDHCNRCQGPKPATMGSYGRGGRGNNNAGGPLRGHSSGRGSRPTPY